MIISYCARCGKRNDVTIWPSTITTNAIDACTCPNVTILPPAIDVRKINAEEISANARNVLSKGEDEKGATSYGEHYKGFPFEVVDIAEAYNLTFNEGNVVKYVLRWRRKGGLTDLMKARDYLNRLIAQEEKRLQEKSEQLSERGLAQKILSWIERTEQENMQEDISLEGVASRLSALANDIEALCKEHISKAGE